jgi:hypothetical protein
MTSSNFILCKEKIAEDDSLSFVTGQFKAVFFLLAKKTILV